MRRAGLLLENFCRDIFVFRYVYVVCFLDVIIKNKINFSEAATCSYWMTAPCMCIYIRLLFFCNIRLLLSTSIRKISNFTVNTK